MYASLFGYELWIERTSYRPAGWFEVMRDGPLDATLFVLGLRIVFSRPGVRSASL